MIDRFKETDCLGELEVREDVYYGIQTERARNNFSISGSTSTNMNLNPTSIEITCYRYAVELKKSLEYLTATIARKDEEFKTVVKTSRTCLQDAVLITLSQEFSGYESFLRRHINLLDELFFSKPLELTLGGTATGTGLSPFDVFDTLMMTDWRRSQKILGSNKIS